MLRTRADWERARAECLADPGAFHGGVAAREIHWFDAALNAWITWSDAEQAWVGFDATTGVPVRAPYGADHAPWARAFDDRQAPLYKWFSGGLTNAGFNEVDRHVLAGHGDEVALLVEGDRWDQSLDGGRGGPVEAYTVTRKQLLWEVAKASVALQSLGLRRGDRIALNMPNIPEQIYYIEAAKRLGIIYTPVFGGFSDKTLSDRIEDAGARVVITADGGYRNAQVVPFKEVYTDPALDNYIPVHTAREIVRDRLASLEGEITVERRDIMRALGRALEAENLDAARVSRLRMDAARALVESPPRVDAVVVVRHTGQPDMVWRPERDRWSHELTDAAARTILAGHAVSEAEFLALPDREFVAAIWATTAPVPVDAEEPLFFIYTSGSTGKPKGVVHVHGGWVSGVAHTMRVSFDAHPGDVIYVIADPGWITGQSYMISAALTTRVTSVLAEGAPTFPSAGRFASIIERYGVTIFKAGVTFLKTVMQDPQSVLDVRHYDLSSLRVATFCAEPVSPAVQAFGMEVVTPQYINSYWATEHGGIAWTHFAGNADFPLKADAHTYPLPWVVGDVWVGNEDGTYRPAEDGEKGEVVIRAPYPYLARTIWGDPERYEQTYWRRWPGVLAYTQGDFAVRYADGSFSFHGRSDDVINVSGHRMGTEEIEGAILRDKQINPDSPVGNVIVVGAPHREKGLTPLAFVKASSGRRLTVEDRRRLTELVRSEKGAVAVPSDFIEVAQFPETRSGKYMRRMVRALVEDAAVGDASTLKNPESLDELRRAIDAWRARQRVSETQRLLETYRYFRIQYNAGVATVTVSNPPVNALNERALDELNIIVEHLNRRDDVTAVIVTGDGTASFVAGADIRQLLDEATTLDEALPLPNNAHLAFRKIEQSTKPWIAAINGVSLGGGLEFALACHYRVAEPTAVFGQPEIRLRLIPGYGGTQRLPRLIPLKHAVEMIIGGRTVTAEDAFALGLVDRVAVGSQDVLSLASVVDPRSVRGERRPAPTPADLDRVLEDPDIQRLVRQAGHAGRAIAVGRALDAIRYGLEHGLDAGLRHEAELFARAVVDPAEGKAGIRAFLDKRSAPLATRRASDAHGDLLPIGAPFFPGHTPIPRYQHAFAAIRDPETGQPLHGDPRIAERAVVVPVEMPGPNEALVYVLASEVNYNDIWAISGIPVSQFDVHDADAHVTGSGGVGLIAALGSEVKAEGRLRVGDLVAIYSGQSDLLSPLAGRDPMFADFHIQGYETPDGSHQQFVKVQGPQLFPIPQDLTLEAAGSYILNLGTIVRALFTTLAIQPGRTMFVEGAATGTGLEALKSARRAGLSVVGMVSSPARAAAIEALGARAVNRREPRFAGLFTPVPITGVDEWEKAGRPLVDAVGHVDYVVSHAGETAFPRSFQLLAAGGTLTFYGATSGYYFTFVGKPGAVSPREMLLRAKLDANEAVLIYYGLSSLVDPVGLEVIEAARGLGARIVVVTYTDAQREFVQSLGFGDAVRGVVSLEEIRRREGDDFDWPATMPPLPDPKTDTDGHRDAVRAFQERTIKPLGAAIGRMLRSPENPRGAPDLVVERAGHDALGASTSLVKPFTGRVVYVEDMGGRRYAFHAPQVWMRQRRIFMPTATILGTHLSNAYEVVRMNRMADAGLLEVTEPLVVAWNDLPEAHQAMWENRHAGASYVCNHALPATGLRSKTELFEAWAT